MASSSVRSFAAALLFVVLFMATEMGPAPKMVADAALCDRLSAGFKGYCGFDSDCKKQCGHEGFSDGHCKFTSTFNSQCFCKKPC